jgi:hypothetical protein
MSAKNVVAIAPKAKPAFVTAMRVFDVEKKKLREANETACAALAKALKGATAQDIVLAVAVVTGCAVKKATGARAATPWVLDRDHANYEGTKTLSRDVRNALAGKASRGKTQTAAKAASKVATPEKVLEAYLSLDTKARATFRKMAKLAIVK